MSGEQRRRLSRRRARREAAPPPPPATPTHGGRGPTGIPVTRLGLLVLLLLGFWLGRLASLVPGDVFDIAIAVISAVVLALWYRRRAREYMRLRAQERARRAR